MLFDDSWVAFNPSELARQAGLQASSQTQSRINLVRGTQRKKIGKR